MLVTERRPSRRTTDFRDTLNRLMVNHEAYTWKQLRERLSGAGHPVGQSQLSQYVNKQRNIQEMEEFFEALSEALDLSLEEEQELSHAFTYSPRKRTTPEHDEKAENFEDTMRGEVEDEGNSSRGDEDTGI